MEYNVRGTKEVASQNEAHTMTLHRTLNEAMHSDKPQAISFSAMLTAGGLQPQNFIRSTNKK